MQMRNVTIIIFLTFFGCVNAAHNIAEKESIYAPVEASLTDIDQKVASHLLVTGVPEGFDEERYKNAVKEVCNSNPGCRSQAEAIFNSYIIRARKIDEMFSVMLCDKVTQWKVMEDLSCNNLRVEIKSWTNKNTPCEFETDWKNIEKKNCIN